MGPLIGLVVLGAAIAGTLACSYEESEQDAPTGSSEPKTPPPAPAMPRSLPECRAEALQLPKAPACLLDEHNDVYFSKDHWASWSVYCTVLREKKSILGHPPFVRKKYPEGIVEGIDETGPFEPRSTHSWADHDRDDKIDTIRIDHTILVANEKYRAEVKVLYGMPEKRFLRLQSANPQEIWLAQQSFDYLLKPAQSLLAGFKESLRSDQVRLKPWKGEEAIILSFNHQGQTLDAWLYPHDKEWIIYDISKDLSKIPPERIGYSIDLAHQKIKGRYHSSEFAVNVREDDPETFPFRNKIIGLIQESEKNKNADFLRYVFGEFKSALNEGTLCTYNRPPLVNTKEFELWFSLGELYQPVSLVADEQGKVIELHFHFSRGDEFIKDPRLLQPIQDRLNSLKKEAERESRK